jgi:PAS domain S-box-containing protein
MTKTSKNFSNLTTLKKKYEELERRYQFIEKASLNLKLFEHTLNSISDCLCITNLNENIIFVNDNFIQTYGYESDELIGQNIKIIRSDKTDQLKVKEIYRSTQNGGWRGEIYNKRKTGSDFLISLRTSVVKDDQGIPIAMVGVSKDLTKDLEAEENLKVAKNKYRSLFEDLKDAVYESSPRGKLIDINPSGVELFGFDSKEELLTADIANDLYVNPKDREIFKKRLERDGYVKNLEIEIKNKQGRKATALETASAVRDKHGKILSYRGILRDITELKKAEIQNKKHLNEIAHANEQLHESEQKLKSLNASKDKFFSIIAHDLRSPFTSLIGLSEFLIEDLDELTIEEIKMYATEINKSSRNVLKLLENLLQWARIQTGKMEFEPSRIDFYEVVEDTILLLGNNASNKKIELTNSVDKNSLVEADRNMISSVVQNLISNAVKFTKMDGKIEVNSNISKNFLNVSVADSGIGISDEDLEKLFVLDNLHSTNGTDEEQGSGLGLVLCKELIEKHNGKIWVKSELDKGSIFHFNLPLQQS